MGAPVEPLVKRIFAMVSGRTAANARVTSSVAMVPRRSETTTAPAGGASDTITFVPASRGWVSTRANVAPLEAYTAPGPTRSTR